MSPPSGAPGPGAPKEGGATVKGSLCLRGMNQREEMTINWEVKKRGENVGTGA